MGDPSDYLPEKIEKEISDIQEKPKIEKQISDMQKNEEKRKAKQFNEERKHIKLEQEKEKQRKLEEDRKIEKDKCYYFQKVNEYLMHYPELSSVYGIQKPSSRAPATEWKLTSDSIENILNRRGAPDMIKSGIKKLYQVMETLGPKMGLNLAEFSQVPENVLWDQQWDPMIQELCIKRPGLCCIPIEFRMIYAFYNSVLLHNLFNTNPEMKRRFEELIMKKIEQERQLMEEMKKQSEVVKE